MFFAGGQMEPEHVLLERIIYKSLGCLYFNHQYHLPGKYGSWITVSDFWPTTSRRPQPCKSKDGPLRNGRITVMFGQYLHFG